MNTTQLLVKAILQNPLGRDWSVQGFGMLRTYLSTGLRLTVWDNELIYQPPPSIIHDHPWDFRSEVVVGRVVNTKFTVLDYSFNRELHRMNEMIIVPGPGLKRGPTRQVWLLEKSAEDVLAGQNYFQEASEIHYTAFDPGTVTLCARDRRGLPDLAHTYWPVGEDWHTAEPHAADSKTIVEVCSRSLDRYF